MTHLKDMSIEELRKADEKRRKPKTIKQHMKDIEKKFPEDRWDAVIKIMGDMRPMAQLPDHLAYEVTEKDND